MFAISSPLRWTTASFLQIIDWQLSEIFFNVDTSRVEWEWLSWTECPSESKVQYWRGFQSPVRQEIFLPESTSVQTFLRLHQYLCARQNSQTLAAIPLCGHTKILHTLVAMGSAALAAAVPYPCKVTRNSRKGQWNSKKIHFKRIDTNPKRITLLHTYFPFHWNGYLL